MDNTDLISVIIPTYNRAHIIKRSVESVLNQTYKNIELIIVDDGSTDNTKEIIDSINDKRIKYIYQANQGAASARNKGIDLAEGQYIAFQDSDDVWHLDKLEKQLKVLKQNDADVIFCKVFLFGNLRKRIVPKNFKEGFLKKDSLPVEISNATLLGKTEVFLNNKFDMEVPRLQDFELLLRIQKKYSIYCLNEALFDYYLQTDSISNKPEKLLKAWKIIMQKNNDISTKQNSDLAFLAFTIIYQAFKIKDIEIKKDLINIAFRLSSSYKTKIQYYLHKICFYKMREMLYKSITIPIKNIIKLFKKII